MTGQAWGPPPSPLSTKRRGKPRQLSNGQTILTPLLGAHTKRAKKRQGLQSGANLAVGHLNMMHERSPIFGFVNGVFDLRIVQGRNRSDPFADSRLPFRDFIPLIVYRTKTVDAGFCIEVSFLCLCLYQSLPPPYLVIRIWIEKGYVLRKIFFFPFDVALARLLKFSVW